MSRLHALPPKGTSASASASASAFASFTSDQRSTQIPSFGISKDRRHLQLYPLPCPQLNLQRTKAKQVTDPLNEAVRARLCGNWIDDAQIMETSIPTVTAKPVYSTSGSDHGVDSATLTDMRFLEEEGEECSRPDFSEEYGSDAESSSVQQSIPFLEKQLCRLLDDEFSTKPEVMALLRDVTRALEMATEKTALSIEEESRRKSHLRRFVMNRLRSSGHNAGICKSRWERTNGYPAGDYEFIHVVVEASSPEVKNNDRLVVDMDFRAQFEIARPTAQYAALVKLLPAFFVGRANMLRDIIKIMCDAAKISLKAKGMHLPPWRKYRYVQAKWLGPYKRTTNPVAFARTDTQSNERELLGRGFGGIASIKGMGWDVGFTHQMELHFEKAVREAQEKLKRQQRQHEHEHASNDVLFRHDKRKSGISRKTESSVLRISGLATALAEAAAQTGSDNVQ